MRCGAMRPPIAHVICTYQYGPCQIYHSARYTRTRFRAASPAANFIQFPIFCRWRARHKQTRRCKKASVPRTYRITWPERNAAGRADSELTLCPTLVPAHGAFNRYIDRYLLVCVMFDSPTWRVNNYSTDWTRNRRWIILRIDTADTYVLHARRRYTKLQIFEKLYKFYFKFII